MNSVGNIVDFPNEILLLIFEYLLPSDRRVASECCKKFLELWLRDKFNGDRRLVFDGCILSDTKEPGSIFMKSERKYTEIVFGEVKEENSKELKTKLGANATSLEIREGYTYKEIDWDKYPKLEMVKVYNVSQLKKFDKIPRDLKKLVIEKMGAECYHFEDEDEDKSLLSYLADYLDSVSDSMKFEINSACLDANFISWFLNSYKNTITKLGFRSVKKEEFKKFSSNSLEHLEVNLTCKQESEIQNDLSDMEGRFPSLKYLSLKIFRTVPHRDWQFLKELKVINLSPEDSPRLNNFKNLEVLDINIYGESYQEAPQCFFTHEPCINPNLKSLSLAIKPNHRYCEDCFKYFTKSFPKLEHLEIFPNLTNEDLTELHANFPKLKILNIIGISNDKLSFESFGNLSKLSIANSSINFETWPNMPHLRELSLRNITLNDLMVKIFEKMPALEKLHMHCEQIIGNAPKLIEQMLKPLKRLVDLKFGSNVNNLKPEIFDKIVNNCKYLRYVDFSKNLKKNSDKVELKRILEKYSYLQRINKIDGYERERKAFWDMLCLDI